MNGPVKLASGFYSHLLHVVVGRMDGEGTLLMFWKVLKVLCKWQFRLIMPLDSGAGISRTSYWSAGLWENISHVTKEGCGKSLVLSTFRREICSMGRRIRATCEG